MAAARPSAAPALGRQPLAGRGAAGSLFVTKGSDRVVAEALAGKYSPFGQNHGCTVYRRTDTPGDGQVLLYYWDSRDGEDQRGWWFGPVVGGEEVWAHHHGAHGRGPPPALPPVQGWRVLHSGEIDPHLEVHAGDEGGASGSGASKRPLAEVPARPTARVSRPVQANGSRDANSVPHVSPTAPMRTAPAPDPQPRSRPAPGATRLPSGPSASLVSSDPSRHDQAFGVPAAAAPLARKRPAPSPRVSHPQAAELETWLKSLDNGTGVMMRYFDRLAAEFDADLSQIAAAKVGGEEKNGIAASVDPAFWETVGVEKAGHKLLFARGIRGLNV